MNTDENEDKLLLIDGNFLLFQSFYASYYPKSMPIMRAPDGTTTNGVHVFLQSLFKMIKFVKPSHLFVAFDAKGKTRRHELYEDYKAGRTKAPEIIFEQFDAIKEILEEMNVKWFEKQGFEADDLIATLSTNNNSTKNIIFSKDKDLLQLVSPNISVLKTKKDKWNFQTYDYDTHLNFEETYSIRPDQVADFKGLSGDQSDNLKGVTGVGLKTAVKLLSEYNTLENIYKNIENVKGKLKENLINDKEQAFFCRKLATLNKNVDMEKGLNFYKINFNIDKSYDIFDKYGLSSVADNFEEVAELYK